MQLSCESFRSTLEPHLHYLFQRANEALIEKHPEYTRLTCERLLALYPHELSLWNLFYKAHDQLLPVPPPHTQNFTKALQRSILLLINRFKIDSKQCFLKFVLKVLLQRLYKEPYRTDLLQAFSHYAYRKNKLLLAQFFLEKALKHAPDNPKILLSLAHLNIANHNPAAALSLLEKLQEHPGVDNAFQIHTLLQQANLQTMLQKS